MKTALITGITGQDGSYLADFLINKGYSVHGIQRRSSSSNDSRINHLFQNNNFHLHYADMTDGTSIMNVLSDVRPHEVYNLAAQSDVHVSFGTPEVTAEINAIGPLRILEAIRFLNLNTKFYQASTSEMFGKAQEFPQTEKTQFYPRSPYGVSKLYGHWITKNYRESYGLFACSGILFNHESPRRGSNFVTQKIVRGLNDVYSNKINFLKIGNLNAKRDWGHAKDFVRGMWMMLQHEYPEDFVLATGEQHSVRYFIEKVVEYYEDSIQWVGEGLEEIGISEKTGKTIVIVDPELFRPAEVESLLGDASHANRILGWQPEVSFEELVIDMCNNVWEGKK